MNVLILDPIAQQQVIRDRRASGGDRYDEVWDGVYILMPQPNNEHQEIVGELVFTFRTALGEAGRGRILPGANVSDHLEDWTRNYRVPDLAVFLEGNPAENRGSYWLGGPDFAVEVVSAEDSAREKLTFYASVGVRELLIVDRQPWALELYRRQGEELTLAAKGVPGDAEPIASEVLGLTFRLLVGDPRPRIEVVHPGDGRS